MANIDGLVMLYGKKCMLTGIRNDLSYHHIEKREHGGTYEEANGGLLWDGVHQWEHNYAELHNKKLYIQTNKTIVEYKQFFIEKPNWFPKWVEEVNQFYLNECIEYYHNKYNMAKVKMLRREYEKRF